jgi:uridine kinase
MQGRCGRGVLSISQDCFYKDLTPEEQVSIASYNFDHPAAFDFAEILSKLQKLRAGAKPVNFPAGFVHTVHLNLNAVSVTFSSQKPFETDSCLFTL